MSKLVNKNCDNCSIRTNCCCKTCFANDQHSIFNHLSDSQLDFLIEGKQEINYKAGETIIKQNTTATYVVCMREGISKVYVEGVKGKNLIVRLISNQDLVTGGGLFNGNIQHFSISALTPVSCCLIDSGRLAKLFAENNEFAVELMRHHTKQNNYLLNKMVNLTQKYMPGRVADTLLYLKNNIYNHNPFTVQLSRQDLADMSNMTKESFVRILQEFKSSEFIRTKGSTFEIISEEGLSSISKNG